MLLAADGARSPPNFKLNADPDVTMGTRQETHGQVAQLVERSPEKAGVGGSSPSLATTSFHTLTYIFLSKRAFLESKLNAAAFA